MTPDKEAQQYAQRLLDFINCGLNKGAVVVDPERPMDDALDWLHRIVYGEPRSAVPPGLREQLVALTELYPRDNGFEVGYTMGAKRALECYDAMLSASPPPGSAQGPDDCDGPWAEGFEQRTGEKP